MQAPVLSIVTPLYNREWCIADCIASTGLAGQPVEMIIVDDGSSDQSVARARAAAAALGFQDRLTILSQANAGPGAARNRAASAASGEWLVFLDSDDLWLPWTLPILMEQLGAAGPDVGLAFAGAGRFADPAAFLATGRAAVQTAMAPDYAAAAVRNPGFIFGSCNAAVRRTAFTAAGGFATSIRCSEDSDLFLRLAGQVLLITAPVLVGVRRSGHSSLTGNATGIVAGLDHMLAAEAAGRYRGSEDDRAGVLAAACAHAIRIAFATGHPALAYRRYVRHAGRLAHPRTRHHLFRLPLTPLLHRLKPASYPFRLAAG